MKKTLQALAAVFVAGGAFVVGTVSEFEFLPAEGTEAVMITLQDSVREGRLVYTRENGEIVDSAWDAPDTLYGGRKNRQIDVRYLDEMRSGEAALGDTFWLSIRQYIAVQDTECIALFKWFPRQETYPPPEDILMHQFKWELFRRPRPDTAKKEVVIP